MALHAEVRLSQRGRGSQPLAPSAAAAAASGSDTEDSDRLGVLLEAARQRQLLGTPMASADGRDDGPRRSSSGASSSQAGLEGLKAGQGASPPPSQGQVAAAMAAAGGAARQLSSSSSEESSSSGESSEDSGDSSSKDGSSGSEGAQQARDASPAAPVLPAPGRTRAAGTAAAEPGSPGSTEGEGGPGGSARRVLPRRAAAPTAGFGTQLHIHPPPATNKELAAMQKRGRETKAPAGRHKRQRDGKAKGGEEAAPAKRPRGRPPQARHQAQQDREPPAKRPMGRSAHAQPATQPAAQQGLLLRCTSLKLLKASWAGTASTGCMRVLSCPTLFVAPTAATHRQQQYRLPMRQTVLPLLPSNRQAFTCALLSSSCLCRIQMAGSTAWSCPWLSPLAARPAPAAAAAAGAATTP